MRVKNICNLFWQYLCLFPPFSDEDDDAAPATIRRNSQFDPQGTVHIGGLGSTADMTKLGGGGGGRRRRREREEEDEEDEDDVALQVPII